MHSMGELRKKETMCGKSNAKRREMPKRAPSQWMADVGLEIEVGQCSVCACLYLFVHEKTDGEKVKEKKDEKKSCP